MRTTAVRWQLAIASCLAILPILAAAAPGLAQDTVGFPLIDRPNHDGAVGSIFILDGAISPGELTNWGFFDNNFAGRQITPLVLRPSGTSYEITGIGTTLSSNALGAQPGAFGLVSGSAATGLGYAFGWKDGSNGANNAGTPEWTGAAPGYVTWLGDSRTSFSPGSSYISSGEFVRTYSVQGTADNLTGEAVGNALFDRVSNDGAVGSIFILNDPFTAAGKLTDWALYDDDNNTPDRQVTPLLLKQNGANWDITAIGTTRTTAENGAQYFAFDLLEGSDLVDEDTYFGFKDGSDGTNNAGVIDYVDLAGGPTVIWLNQNNTSFDVGDSFAVAGTFARSYSVQAISVAIPEPASLAVWSLLGGGLGVWLIRRRQR